MKDGPNKDKSEQNFQWKKENKEPYNFYNMYARKGSITLDEIQS